MTRQISVDLTPQAMLDDYVLVHAGFAIEVVSQEDAQATLDLIDQIPELVDDMSDAMFDLNTFKDPKRARKLIGAIEAVTPIGRAHV